MAKYYGYCYDANGKFTEIIPLDEKPIYEKQTFHREEQKEIITEEKLCEVHQSIEDGTYEPPLPDPGEGPENIDEAIVFEATYSEPISKQDCPDCVMHNVEYETIKVLYEEDVIVGYEPDIPANCTLEVCPWLAYDPVFDGEKWVKTVEPQPEEPQPEEPSELEKLKQHQELMQQALDELLLGGM
ncbi:hypothetical protein ACS47_13160 [Bacillus cereus]|uniref:Uncharacterized protein n=2 Tax=Cecivirus TaxID=1623290 RepID=B5LPS7_9CAUD|nr:MULTISPECIES: hypothetical protein [Bacteria]YP_002154391.1 hypothetical protein IEBH_gp66 [Bacillus phage IEBH]YP_009219598.1 hypothetical protein AVT71_gp24 [Bacillus phage 250]KLA15663.1 hypothetical protein B4078_5478 [Bacillus cereus]ACH42323.1 hypothetical protein [Bacillus phage IEBH]ADB28392.1 hypothetical protein [Bacillus phage 250]KXI81059.1 hypothetical protein ACS54_08815 [Bacillus cereus]KXI88119.1 hypothetical protein ACS47_13160 [Bacillus cereus]